MVFYYRLPPGATITFAQTSNEYDSVHVLLHGGTSVSCNEILSYQEGTEITCVDDGDLDAVTYTNNLPIEQDVYYVQSGYSNAAGQFVLEWNITTSSLGTCTTH